MNILQFTSSFPLNEKDFGGVFVRELVEELSPYFQFYILTPDAPNSKVYEKFASCEVFRYRYFFKKKQILVCDDSIVQNLKKNKLYYFVLPIFLLSGFISLIKIINRKQIDIVQAHWILPQGLIAVFARVFSKKKIKVIVTSHGTDINLADRTIFRPLIKYTLTKCDSINPVSNYLRDKIISLVKSSEKINTIPMGTKETISQKNENNETAADIKIKNEYLLYVGRLSEDKDIPTLIDAFNKIRPENPELFLYLAGTGNELKKLEDLVSQLNIRERVIFLGQLDKEQLYRYYRKAKMLVSTSLTEGFGLVFVEALLNRCPVIATDVGGVKEIIIHGETGLLVEPKNVNKLILSINLLLRDSDLRLKLTSSGYNHAIEKYSWRKVGKQFFGLYSDLTTNCSNNS